MGNQAYANRPYASGLVMHASRKSVPAAGECTYLTFNYAIVLSLVSESLDLLCARIEASFFAALIAITSQKMHRPLPHAIFRKGRLPPLPP